MKHIPHFMLLVLLACAGIAGAADLHGLEDPSDRERFQRLSFELRCPKCQNQNLADSNAPVAADLRSEIARLIGEGRSNREIVEYMVARYGEFVRYEPRVGGINLLLWLLPALGLLIGALVIWQRTRRSVAGDAPLMDAAQREQARRLLQEAARQRADGQERAGPEA